MKIHTLTIVGVGLIGGSIGLAARQRGLAERILGVGRRMETLERARNLGAIDHGFVALAPAVSEADLVVFCTPVDRIADQVLEAGKLCRPGTLLTDAGSTKAVLVRTVEEQLPSSVAFVGSHPLAGSEKRGPEYADADLFKGRLTIVTRTERTNAVALEKTAAFWQALGARLRIMDPEAHDRALALTSHLPHLVASGLSGLLTPNLIPLAATGFRDTTRIAAGDPALWTAIFRQNRAAVSDALTHLEQRLQQFRTALAADDTAALDAWLAQGKTVRDTLGS